jgi:hypothetical protein
VAVLRVVVSMVLSIALTVAVQLAARAQLPPERRARGWNAATWGAAVYAFGPLSMLGFFWVTRKPGWWGALEALGRAVLAASLVLGLMWGVDMLFDMFTGPTSWRG